MFLVAIDQGTTSTRAIVFDAELRAVASAQEELRQLYPAPGWVEHDPEEIWAATVATVRAAMLRADASARDVAAIGITNQRETAIVWDRESGKPIHNAIVWQDRRTDDVCASLRAASHETAIQREDRAPARSLFLSDQDRMAARSRRGRTPPRRGRAPRLRHGGFVSAVAADRRPRPCDRRDQRRAHASV